jgi:hypothetical protein
MRIVSVLAATGAGAVAGWVCGLIPIWLGARLTAATLIGSFVGSVGVVVFMLAGLTRTGRGGLGAVSLGVSEALLLGIPAVGLAVVVGYLTLRWLGWSPASLASYGPMLFGGGAALIMAIWVARGMVMTSGGS